MKIHQYLKRFGLAVFPVFLTWQGSQAAYAGSMFFGQDQNVSTSLASQAELEFLSHLQQVQTEDFESFAPGTSSPIATPLTLMFGLDTATLIGGGAVRGAAFNGLHAISGKNYWSLTFAEQVRGTYTIAFNTEQAAFGFYATDMGDSGGNAFSLIFNHFDSSQSVVSIPHVLGDVDANELFFGYIDTSKPFTSVTFIASGPIERDGFGLDKVTIGRVSNVVPESVPEPRVLAGLVCLGLLGLPKMMRRQRHLLR